MPCLAALQGYPALACAMPGQRPDHSVASVLIVVPVVVLLGLGIVLLSRGESRGGFLLALALPAAAISVHNWRRHFRDTP